VPREIRVGRGTASTVQALEDLVKIEDVHASTFGNGAPPWPQRSGD
jgi:hypothetical protein